jgi:hypothetical protein
VLRTAEVTKAVLCISQTMTSIDKQQERRESLTASNGIQEVVGSSPISSTINFLFIIKPWRIIEMLLYLPGCRVFV